MGWADGGWDGWKVGRHLVYQNLSVVFVLLTCCIWISNKWFWKGSIRDVIQKGAPIHHLVSTS